MNMLMHKKYLWLYMSLFFLVGLSACVDLVDEGLEVNYPLSDASLTVQAITAEKGAVDETISYQISVSSSEDIKSCIVQSSNPGQNGSGFNVSDPAFDDPFIDHIFGTVQKNTQSFTARFDYIIPKDINKSRLSFSVIDEAGKVSIEKTIEVVPSIARYSNQKLYAKDKNFQDAFASIEGEVYEDIKSNYSSVSEANREVQEKIDILFYYDANARRSTIAAPASERLGLSLSVENKTLFKKLSGLNISDISELSPAYISQLRENASLLQEGSMQIDNLKVGDVVGFITDLNARHSLKTGLLIVTGLHPSTVPQYDGVSYVLECDIVVQE
ncbi:MAG: hypothetical protein R8P61_15790 [Bacteroidia bacterium]|nr:hypothetical protein [Bacteroidia bacterium]